MKKVAFYVLLGLAAVAVGQATFAPPYGPVDVLPVVKRGRITCMDKTRFLMTSEDGRKHCIRLVSYGDYAR